MNASNGWQRYAQCVYRWRWLVLVGSLLAVGLAIWGASTLSFASRYQVWFRDDNPDLQAFNHMEDTYGRNDFVTIAVAPGSGKVFEPQTLEALRKITQEAWKLPFVQRVDSITNFQHIEASEDEIRVHDLVEQGRTYSPSELEELKALAVAEPLLINRLISPDAAVAGIQAKIDPPPGNREAPGKVASEARALRDHFEQEYPDLEIHLAGAIMMNDAFTQAAEHDMLTLTPLMLAVVLVGLALLLKSVQGTFSVLMIMICSVAGAMGLAGWFGIKLTAPSSVAPTMILTLAIADGVHLLATFLQSLREGKDKRLALEESLRLNFKPVFYTSLTTVIGLLAMNSSDAKPFNDLGNIAAMGVGIAWLMSVTLFPSLLMILPFKPRAEPKRLIWPAQLASFVVAMRARTLMLILLPLVLLVGLGFQNRINNNLLHYFDRSVEYRRDADFVEHHLTGTYSLLFSVPSGRSGGVTDPEYLSTLDRFADWYQQQAHVVHATSFADNIKRINQAMHGGDSEHYSIPKDSASAAQYLLMYEMSLPYGLDLNSTVDIDKASTLMLVILGDVPSRTALELAARGEQWLKANAPKAMHTQASSSTLMFANIAERSGHGMVTSLILALVLVSICLTLMIRDVRMGLLSVIPNALPLLAGFGVWALIDGEISVAFAAVAPMALGIIVDDTIHLLTKYAKVRRGENRSATEAIGDAMTTTGQAIVTTSIVLIVGFGLLTMSAFKLNSTMGILTSIIVALALIGDLLMLPRLLIRFDRWLGLKRATVPPEAAGAELRA